MKPQHWYHVIWAVLAIPLVIVVAEGLMALTPVFTLFLPKFPLLGYLASLEDPWQHLCIGHVMAVLQVLLCYGMGDAMLRIFWGKRYAKSVPLPRSAQVMERILGGMIVASTLLVVALGIVALL